MRTVRSLYWLAVFAAITGCRSGGGGGGWSVWNPFSRWGQETAIADSAPELPSQQFAEASKTPASKPSALASKGAQSAGSTLSSAPAYTPPAAIARAASTTPASPNLGVSSAPAHTPPANGGAAAPSPATGNTLASGPSASVAATGPYDPNGYRAATPLPTSASTPGLNRYGMPDRYAAAAASSIHATPGETPTPTTSFPGRDRYAAYETPSATPPAKDASPAGTTPQVEQAAATVNLTTPAGQYRPAGTSSYPLTDPEQVNVASLPEKPVGTTPTPPAPASSTPAYPATGAPEPSSIYGAPGYR